MIIYEIPGNPVPLQRHRHSGKRTYDPQKKEKEKHQWLLRSCINSFKPLNSAIKLVVEYHMPIPKSYSKKKALECLLGPHCCKPDLSNLIKFTEDTYNSMVWSDDSLICEIDAKKFYSLTPKTVFRVEQVSKKYKVMK